MTDARARAVIFASAGQLTMRDVSLREPAVDECIVATHFSSISAGTEKLLFNGKLPGMSQLMYPLVPGYEAAGIVTSIGAAVTEVAIGDSVFVGGSMCYTDVNAAFGGQSSRTVKKASQLVPLHGIPLAHAPLLALAATSLHGVLRVPVAGKRVAVVGMGAIGQFAARFLATMGCASVYEADIATDRLGHVPGVVSVDLNATTLKEAAPDGIDIVFEATGASGVLSACAKALSPGGTIVLLSYYDELQTPFVDLFIKEATLVASREWAHSDLLTARDAIADGAVRVDDLATTIIPVERYDDAYARAFGDSSTLKVVLQWA
jgi:3-hydroxyethyl bacteriochlorophyllide a dehydrogenase